MDRIGDSKQQKDRKKKLDARVEVEDSKQQPSLVEIGSSANYNTISTY